MKLSVVNISLHFDLTTYLFVNVPHTFTNDFMKTEIVDAEEKEKKIVKAYILMALVTLNITALNEITDIKNHVQSFIYRI